MRRIGIVALVIALAACSGSDSTSPTVTVTGNYAMRTVNGFSLPYTFPQGGTITSTTLTLFEDGSYRASTRYSDGSIITEQGFWSNTNGSITFIDQTDNITYTASLSGSVLTEIFQGLTETFEKL